MRQLGARLPELPPADTDVQINREAPTETEPYEPYPVEVHRIERRAVAPDFPGSPAPPAAPPETLETRPAEVRPIEPHPPEPPTPELPTPEPRPVEPTLIEQPPKSAEPPPKPPQRPYDNESIRIHEVAPGPENVSSARWEEFHEFRRLEPGRGARLSLEPMPPSSHGPSSRLLAADLEPRRHSSFLTIAVPGIAAVLAVGAIVWSGSLRDRMHQQDAVVSALQAQNQKLADTVAEMSTEQGATSTTTSNANPANAPAAAASTQIPQAENPPAANPADAQSPTQPAAESEPPAQPTRKGTVRHAENRQGVATPPSVQQSSSRGRSRYRQPVDAGYTPEIVPPYPTTFKAENTAPNPAASQPVPNAGTSSAGTYREPVSVAGTSQPPAAPAEASHPAPREAAPQPSRTSALAASAPGSNGGVPASTSYSPTGNGQYTSPLAQNIETVEGLQRHSQVPLKEFHARAGMLTKLTPAVGVSVQQPDPGHGTYALVVDGSGSSYQVRGQVNRPVLFTDNATHLEYELVVLHIADQQVYGYVRTVH